MHNNNAIPTALVYSDFSRRLAGYYSNVSNFKTIMQVYSECKNPVTQIIQRWSTIMGCTGRCFITVFNNQFGTGFAVRNNS